MNIVIPCGGLGDRFAKDGYTDPKPLIPAMGRPILSWLLEGLEFSKDDTLVVAYNVDLEKWRMEDRLRACVGGRIPLRVVHLAGPTRGAAETVALALQALTPEERDRKTMLLDCDTFYRADIVGTFRSWDLPINMCVVFRDEGVSPIYSYSELDTSHNILGIKEKERISPWANSGCYSFACGDLLLKYCTRVLSTTVAPRLGEFYMSSVIQTMLADNLPFRALCVGREDVVCLGTPLQLRLFCATGPEFSPRRICFDLDGTLVTHPNADRDYSTVLPYTATINFLKYLKRLGNTIIIQTARGMRSCHGNVGLIHAKASVAVYEVLRRFDIPYDELYFGKPYAHVYVDDLAHNVCENLQKATGFYETSVEERAHNYLQNSMLKTLVKRSSLPLDGEIHWYLNIPVSIRHLFPAFIRKAHDNSWYEIEKVESTTCSYLYVQESLTPADLDRVLSSLQTIHESMAPCSQEKEELDMYANYKGKLAARFEVYDYRGKFGKERAEALYNLLVDALEGYEEKDGGRLGVVHGDPVLSNVLMERGAELRFVDMRGKQGSRTTMWGDVLYDYAKVFQSLSGYDEILLGRRVSSAYRTALLNIFCKHVTARFGEGILEMIRVLTSSLFFSLIPLHDNDKCLGYFEKAWELMHV